MNSPEGAMSPEGARTPAGHEKSPPNVSLSVLVSKTDSGNGPIEQASGGGEKSPPGL